MAGSRLREVGALLCWGAPFRLEDVPTVSTVAAVPGVQPSMMEALRLWQRLVCVEGPSP